MNKRMEEHSKLQSSAVHEHASRTGHNIDWDSTKVLDREQHYYKRKVKEAIHIWQQRPSLNRDAGLDLPSIYNHLFSHNWHSQLCEIAVNNISHYKPELLHNTEEDHETWSKVFGKANLQTL